MSGAGEKKMKILIAILFLSGCPLPPPVLAKQRGNQQTLEGPVELYDPATREKIEPTPSPRSRLSENVYQIIPHEIDGKIVCLKYRVSEENEWVPLERVVCPWETRIECFHEWQPSYWSLVDKRPKTTTYDVHIPGKIGNVQVCKSCGLIRMEPKK